MNISDKTIKQLQKQFGIITFFKGCNEVNKEDATELSILYDQNGNYVSIKFKTTSKKEITFNDIVKKTETKVKPTDLNTFKKLSSLCGVTEHTTYGLSLCSMHPKFNSNQNKVDNILKKLGINFKKEYSDSRLVLRYKINKKELSNL
jgi:hypothetical protein